MIDRRQFLALGAGLVLARSSSAFGKADFTLGLLPWGGRNQRVAIAGLQRWVFEMESRTSVRVGAKPFQVKPTAIAQTRQGILVLSGSQSFRLPNTAVLTQLRTFLARGGILFLDNEKGARDNGFDRSARQLLRQLSGKQSSSFSFVPREHVLYKSFYLLDKPVGRTANSPVLEAHFDSAAAASANVIYSTNHLLGALARDRNGTGMFRPTPGGERQREMATRLAVNIAMYALCSNYKEDQVHVPFILKRRRWRPDDNGVQIP